MSSPFLETAIAAARAAEAVIHRYYRGEYGVEIKPDQSPVTVADVECEQAIRAVIAEAFPGHGFFGEETGKTNAGAEYLWLIDPIDGTKSFVRHYPFFSTQIALMHRGEILLGVSNAPLYGEMAWAERGAGAQLDGESLRVSGVEGLDAAHLSLGNVMSLAAGPRWAGVGALVRTAHRTRGYGDFLHYHLLAAGRIDAVVESDVNVLDVAALSLVVREAGGVFTDLEGGPLTLETRSVAAAATPALHAELLARLAG
jgi:histidinol-phosphatase